MQEDLTSLNKAETDTHTLLIFLGLICWELGLDAMSLAELYSALLSLWLESNMWKANPQYPNHIHKNLDNFPRISLPKGKCKLFRKILCNLSWNPQGWTKTHVKFLLLLAWRGRWIWCSYGAKHTWSGVRETKGRSRGKREKFQGPSATYMRMGAKK